MARVRERLAAQGIEADGVRVPAAPTEPADDVWAELRELGIGDEHGGVEPAWAAAIGQHLLSPVRATLRASTGTIGATTGLTLVDDRVLLIHDAVRRGPGPRDPEVTAVSRHVDVVLVRVDDLWPAITRFLPPLHQLTAGARPSGRSSSLPTTPLDRAQVESLRTGTDVDTLPAAARAVVQDEHASFAVVVEAWPTPAGPSVVWSRWWSVAGDLLLDVQLRDDGVRLVERAPGAVAAELRWALVGAIDVTAGAPRAVVGEGGER
ncbi:hypothetical protein V5D56_16095 [Cellulosimicrobium sp. PMB13]|uniref:hypothetical protein n=1 Tax=Cellulosimicrobium sp. PMB13 TaxID=3120158 RepID=UPI003F4B7B34